MQNQDKRRIIIKRRRSSGHADYHGGNWKVAYADFVTALMAFFLLLWILNSTPSAKLKGIAAYFTPTIGLMNLRSFEGEIAETRSESEDEVSSKGPSVQGVTEGVRQIGQVISFEKSKTNEEIDAERVSSLLLIKESIQKEIEKDPQLGQFRDNLHFQQTPEGLIIEIVDQTKKPMFDDRSAELNKDAQKILIKISNLIKYSPNILSVTGHTNRSGGVAAYSGVKGSWKISGDRAYNVMSFLLSRGIPIERINRLVAAADAQPLDSGNPYSLNNNRVSIMLLKEGLLPNHKISAPN